MRVHLGHGQQEADNTCKKVAPGFTARSGTYFLFFRGFEGLWRMKLYIHTFSKQIWSLSNAPRICIWLRPFKKGYMCILTRKDPSSGPPAFFKQTHTHKHSAWWNSWVIGSLCLHCCVLARPVMAPFAVCSNGVNRISSLSTAFPHLARGWVVNACGFVCWWPTAYPSTGFQGMSVWQIPTELL